jgi:hypothetical protein
MRIENGRNEIGNLEKEKFENDRQRIQWNAPISIRSARVGRRSDTGGRTTRFDLAQLHLQARTSQRIAGAGTAQ